MNEIANPLPKQITPEKIEQVESCMLKEEQVDCPVTHKFGPGIYIREVFLPAGSYVVGHHHNHETLKSITNSSLLMTVLKILKTTIFF